MLETACRTRRSTTHLTDLENKCSETKTKLCEMQDRWTMIALLTNVENGEKKKVRLVDM